MHGKMSSKQLLANRPTIDTTDKKSSGSNVLAALVPGSLDAASLNDDGLATGHAAGVHHGEERAGRGVDRLERGAAGIMWRGWSNDKY